MNSRAHSQARIDSSSITMTYPRDVHLSILAEIRPFLGFCCTDSYHWSDEVLSSVMHATAETLTLDTCCTSCSMAAVCNFSVAAKLWRRLELPRLLPHSTSRLFF